MKKKLLLLTAILTLTNAVVANASWEWEKTVIDEENRANTIFIDNEGLIRTYNVVTRRDNTEHWEYGKIYRYDGQTITISDSELELPGSLSEGETAVGLLGLRPGEIYDEEEEIIDTDGTSLGTIPEAVARATVFDEDGLSKITIWNKGSYYMERNLENIFDGYYHCIGKLDKNTFITTDDDKLTMLKRAFPKTIGHTDIRAYINKHEIPCFNVNGRAVVTAEELRGYGFDVIWDGAARRLDIVRNRDRYDVNGLPIPEKGESGTYYGNIYDTDIKVYFEGKHINGYASDGITFVRLEDLKSSDTSFNYNDEERRLDMRVKYLDGEYIYEEALVTEQTGTLTRLSGTSVWLTKKYTGPVYYPGANRDIKEFETHYVDYGAYDFTDGNITKIESPAENVRDSASGATVIYPIDEEEIGFDLEYKSIAALIGSGNYRVEMEDGYHVFDKTGYDVFGKGFTDVAALSGNMYAVTDSRGLTLIKR